MIDARTEELINAALDDELDTTERAELDALLAQSAQARAYQDSLQQLDRQLQALPEQEIPAGLHEEITAAVKLTTPIRREAAVPTVAAWPGVVRYGLAASLGLAIAIGFYESQPDMSRAADYDRMIGTIAPANRDQLRVLGEFAFSETGLSSRGSIASGANGTVLDIAVDSDELIDIEIDLARAGLAFDALAQTHNHLPSFSVAGNVIHARSRGRQRFAVLLNPSDAPRPDSAARIRIKYARDGQLIEQRELAAF